VAAGRLADKGLRVTIVEADLVGGECSYYACMPSKALLRPAQALSEARRVPGAAEPVTASLDVAAVLSRRDMIVGHRRFRWWMRYRGRVRASALVAML
jgi:pyruvate/2-oxoglutarate dehydrogenase complex dihydrolipoamide dehydrogenase (E3) component